MKKIPSLFMRNYDGDRLVRDEVTPGCEWVQNGEGVATLKLDGTSCLVKDGKLYKRYDAKHGRAPTPGFIPCEEAPDPVTGHWPGWVPVGDGPADKWHREAVQHNWFDGKLMLNDGTYELVGPKIQGHPYGPSVDRLTDRHCLMQHSTLTIPESKEDPARTFEGLKDYFSRAEIEGVVWHHPDGRMCKIKRKDFGYPWPVKKNE